MSTQSGLRREITLVPLVLYGLGTTIGAGIYALTGEVAGEAGTHAPLAFLVAAVLAAATGLSFAELAGRLPKAAGEAVFVRHAFGLPILSRIVGLAVVTAGLVAGAAITNAFGGYLSEVTSIPRPAAVIALVLALGAFAIVGVKASVTVAGVFTVVELIGLALVVWSVRNVVGTFDGSFADLFIPTDLGIVTGVFGGAFLAFFAFLGFEDIDSVAEEATDPTRTLPRAIIWTLAITTVLYVAVASVAVMSLPIAELAASDAPLAAVAGASSGLGDTLAVIGTLAMVNGALVQIVMVPRILYGMSRLGDAPRIFGRVNARTATPIVGTVVAMVAIGLMAVFFDLGGLARITSALTIAVFATINISLLRIKTREPEAPGYRAPMWVPVAGVAISVLMFAVEAGSLFGG